MLFGMVTDSNNEQPLKAESAIEVHPSEIIQVVFPCGQKTSVV